VRFSPLCPYRGTPMSLQGYLTYKRHPPPRTLHPTFTADAGALVRFSPFSSGAPAASIPSAANRSLRFAPCFKSHSVNMT